MALEAATRSNAPWLARYYGSRRGLACTVWHRFLHLFGRYREYYQVEWSSVNRLVFVCKGNICRSAFAEAVAHSLDIEAISCGLDTIEDAPANEEARRIAEYQGFDLADHRTMPVMYLVLKKTDLLVAMEPWQAEFLNKHLMRHTQCTLLGLWTKPVLPHIHDPYGSNQAYFDKCFSYIQESVNELAKRIKK